MRSEHHGGLGRFADTPAGSLEIPRKERARRLELELEAARAARAELMAGQAASEREVQQLRTELQVALG